MLIINKRRERFKRGFTLAEILITLVILGFVAALSVPMIGQQRLKKPTKIKQNHGIFECYYDAQGQLRQHEANNLDNTDTDDIVTGGACYFKAPPANYYTIQVVGAGGNGGLYGSYTKPSYTFSSYGEKEKGEISLDTKFQKTLSEAPDWVREKWNLQWAKGASKPSYIIESPVGRSGNSICVVERYVDGTDCSNCNINDDYCREECIKYKSAKGGNSGRGGKYEFSLPLDVNYNIEVDSSIKDITLKFAENVFVKVLASGGGENAYEQPKGVPVPGSNGQDFNYSQNVIANGVSKGQTTILNNSQRGAGGSGILGCSDTGGNLEGYTPNGGNIKFPDYKIPYKLEALAINAVFGQAGEASLPVTKVYEKLPATELKLVPTKEAGSSASSIVYANTNSGYKKIVESKSGNNGVAYSGSSQQLVILTGDGDFPFPKEYYPDKLTSAIPDAASFTSAEFESKVLELQQNGKAPGSSGYGAYPIVTNVTGSTKYWINNINIGTIQYPTIDYTSQLASLSCLSKNAKKINTTGKYYCEATKGNPGEIVIIW